MKRKMKHVLFLQLPRLENSTSGEEENLPLAGLYLAHAIKRAKIDSGFRFLGPDEETLDDAHLIDLILGWKPDIICATLYLWNVERTLSILKRIKATQPDVLIICGGPEVAPDHPILFKVPIADALIMGEGEGIIADVIQGLYGGARPDYKQVAWRINSDYLFGKKNAPNLDILKSLPPPEDMIWRPDSQGMAYMETGRGCPMKCSYCRYPQMRRRPIFLEANEVLKRIKILKRRGANQIRFIDPTFNANPSFRQILKGLKNINKGKKILFFAELHADILEPDDINALAEAGFKEIEVGVQSMDKDVLRLIHRPIRIEKLEANIRLMVNAGIRVTVDLMYGLPEQRLEDVSSSFGWALQFKNTHIQCMQTLLLPGTELRENKDRWGLQANDRPPYDVRATERLSPDDICVIEELLNKNQAGESMTSRFVGQRLPDLFKERINMSFKPLDKNAAIKGKSSKRALIFEGPDLYSWRKGILNVISSAITGEPHILWQFVIKPEEEEPLDLLNDMIREIKNLPTHWLDHFAHAACWERIAARRIFIQLKKGHTCSEGWIQAAEALLEDHFY
jgi:radical SAM superfamily enzyme YgiQ (UPF0313 family)